MKGAGVRAKLVGPRHIGRPPNSSVRDARFYRQPLLGDFGCLSYAYMSGLMGSKKTERPENRQVPRPPPTEATIGGHTDEVESRRG